MLVPGPKTGTGIVYEGKPEVLGEEPTVGLGDGRPRASLQQRPRGFARELDWPTWTHIYKAIAEAR